MTTATDTLRTDAIAQYRVLGEETDPGLEALARLAATVCATSAAAVNLIDDRLQHTVAVVGIQPGVCRRDDSMCAVVFEDGQTVVVDDALMGITEIVRGCDLLSSTPQQLYLYQLLGFTPPAFIHVPLLMAADGRRLSKRDRDLDLGFLRQHFVSPQPLIGLLAFLAGLLPAPEPVSAKELLPLFSWQKVPHNNIIVSEKLLNLFKL